MDEAGKERIIDLHELAEITNEAYENSNIYKAKMKAFHDKHLRGENFMSIKKYGSIILDLDSFLVNSNNGGMVLIFWLKFFIVVVFYCVIERQVSNSR